MNAAVDVVKRCAPQWLKEGARHGFRTIGVATSNQRPLPEFLIIGTKRGGTTSLWRYLLEHPAVLPLYPTAENVKSPHFFDIHYGRGEHWYRSHMPSEATRARTKRHTGFAPVTGDASPYYMFHPAVPERVATHMPSAKMVVLLRDPVERAFSHYKERRKNGTEPLSFRDALVAEAARLRGETERILADPTYYSTRHDFFSYLARGRYAEQLDRWMRHFSPEQLLILRSEDMYLEPSTTVRRVHAFLGLPQRDLQRPEPFNALPTGNLSQEDRHWLVEYYRPHVLDLRSRFGSDLTWDWCAR